MQSTRLTDAINRTDDGRTTDGDLAIAEGVADFVFFTSRALELALAPFGGGLGQIQFVAQDALVFALRNAQIAYSFGTLEHLCNRKQRAETTQ